MICLVAEWRWGGIAGGAGLICVEDVEGDRQNAEDARDTQTSKFMTDQRHLNVHNLMP